MTNRALGQISRIGAVAPVVVGLLLFLGCSSLQDNTVIPKDSIPDLSRPEAEVNRLFRENPPDLIAILPFENLTESSDMEEEKEEVEVIRTTFANHFSSRGYNTQWTQLTDKLLADGGLDAVEDIVKLPPEELGRLTRADVLIYGQVTHFNRLYLGLYAQIVVGARVKMVEVQTGKVLWEAEDVLREHSGGFSIEPIGLILTLASNAVAMRKAEVMGAVEELFRDLVQTIPLAKMEHDLRPPTITLLVNEASTQRVRAGGTIRVGMTGDPGLQARFDLGEYHKGIEMEEVEPGAYIGSYTVKPGDHAENLIVRGYLEDSNGLVTEWVDSIGPVILDTKAPSEPQGVFAAGRDQVVTVTWEPNTESDLAGYKVYRSATALTGYETHVQTESPTLVDSKLTNNQTYYYRVSAVDEAGNESPVSETAAGSPVRPGPTPVRGLIVRDTMWFAGGSPYVLEGKVTVGQGATVRIEPGTVIHSKGGELRIRGRLLARGRPDQMIIFTAHSSAPDSRWSGILFDQTGERESVLEWVRVTQARIGVHCIAASPKIVSGEFTENIVGISIASGSAHPMVEGNLIAQNAQDGIQIKNGARPTFTANRVLKNGHYGIAVVNTPGLTLQNNDFLGNRVLQLVNDSTTETVDASGNWWGTTEGSAIMSLIGGRVMVRNVLEGPAPSERVISLPVVDGPLEGTIDTSVILLTANSPYLVTSPVVIEGGSTVTIQGGVTLMFQPGHTGVVVKKGAIQALGTPERPILFTSANASPRPGDYDTAIRFEGDGPVPSLLRYVVVLYAGTALVVKQGSPEISHAYIAHNLQSAMECSGTSSPKISYSTIAHHPNNAAVLCAGQSQPVLYRNNFVSNGWAVINYSTMPLEARENWWGRPTPDRSLFVGSVEYTPSLRRPEPEVFAYDIGRRDGSGNRNFKRPF